MYVVFDSVVNFITTHCQEDLCSSPVLCGLTIAPCEFSFRGSSSTTKVTASQ